MFGADAEDRYPSMKRILAVLTSMQLSRPWARVRESNFAKLHVCWRLPRCFHSCLGGLFSSKNLGDVFVEMLFLVGVAMVLQL